MEEYESCAKCLQYLNKIEHQVRFRDAVLPTDAAADGWKSAELLKHYNRAVELLPEDWCDENYIIISVRHALLLLSVDEMNATFCINLIRINCNKAQVSLAMAEYYLKKNDRDSALTCLERAQHRGAQPTGLIDEALAALKRNTASLNHLIDARFCYEPPDEVPAYKVDASGESRTASKHRPRKPKIASADHSGATKPLIFPSEQLIYKPMRVPRKRQDDEESQGCSESPSSSGERCGAASVEVEARQLTEGGPLPARPGQSQEGRVPAWAPKVPVVGRKTGPQLTFRPSKLDLPIRRIKLDLPIRRNFQPQRISKKSADDADSSDRLGTLASVTEVLEAEGSSAAHDGAELSAKKKLLEHTEVERQSRTSSHPTVVEAPFRPCSELRKDEKVSEAHSSRSLVTPACHPCSNAAERIPEKVSVAPSSSRVISSDNLLTLKAIHPNPSPHTCPPDSSASNSMYNNSSVASTGTTRHSASPSGGGGDGDVSSSSLRRPPPASVLPRPSSANQREAVRSACDPPRQPADTGSARSEKENLQPFVGNISKVAEILEPINHVVSAKNAQQICDPPPHVDPYALNFGEVNPRRKNICINGQVYDISKVIGRGGSSVVYEARKGEDGDACAIKLVSFVAVDNKVIASYKNEVEMLLRLQKTGKIIRLFDHEIKEDGMALVMERAEADFKSVHAHLLAKGESGSSKASLLPASQCLSLWKEMLECVATLHENGVVHLDLKPGNFVLVRGVPKLIDLGISHSIPEDRTSVTLQHQLGTIDYMSPEQLPDCLSDDPDDGESVKKRIGRKSDVWALGCILYLLMFGRPPFRGMHILKRLHTINSNKPVAIPDYPASPQLMEALQMCLLRDPNARAAVSDLLAFLNKKPA